MITKGNIAPGERLPSERELAKTTRAGRGHVRLALQMLQHYGIVSTHQQSGSYLANVSTVALGEMLSAIFNIKEPEIGAMLEARRLVESEAAALAADRINLQQIQELKQAFKNYRNKLLQGCDALEEDMLFHVKIAECSGNVFFQNMVMTMAFEMIKKTRAIDGCEGKRKSDALKEHLKILNAIVSRKAAAARRAMMRHLMNTRSQRTQIQDIVDNNKASAME